jgi:hypothetical protein
VFTALVQISIPRRLSDESIREIFDRTSQNYLGVPGLIRKYYLVSEDRRTIGGCYLWETKEDAERIYTPEWRKFVVERYGGPEPTVTFFETNIVVETAQSRIDTYWPEQANA